MDARSAAPSAARGEGLSPAPNNPSLPLAPRPLNEAPTAPVIEAQILCAEGESPRADSVLRPPLTGCEFRVRDAPVDIHADHDPQGSLCEVTAILVATIGVHSLESQAVQIT